MFCNLISLYSWWCYNSTLQECWISCSHSAWLHLLTKRRNRHTNALYQSTWSKKLLCTHEGEGLHWQTLSRARFGISCSLALPALACIQSWLWSKQILANQIAHWPIARNIYSNLYGKLQLWRSHLLYCIHHQESYTLKYLYSTCISLTGQLHTFATRPCAHEGLT